MPNVEILSLSVNNISDLSPLASCYKLTELYLRKNSVSDISQLTYLAGLPALKVLWLSDNPITSHPQYRSLVARAVPGLQKLDNIDITPDDRAGGSSVPDIPTPASPYAPSSNQQQDPVDPSPRRARGGWGGVEVAGIRAAAMSPRGEMVSSGSASNLNVMTSSPSSEYIPSSPQQPKGAQQHSQPSTPKSAGMRAYRSMSSLPQSPSEQPSAHVGVSPSPRRRGPAVFHDEMASPRQGRPPSGKTTPRAVPMSPGRVHPSPSPGSSTNVELAVLALLNELTPDGLLSVRSEIDARLGGGGGFRRQ